MAKRHGGVVTFGVLGIIAGAVGSLANGLLLLMLLLAKSRSGEIDPGAQAALASVNAGMIAAIVANVITSVMVLVCGIGLFFYKSWARLGYLAAAAITILNRLLTFPLHFQPPATPDDGGDAMAQIGYQVGRIGGDIGTMIFSGVALWFFNRSTIKALFTRASTPSP